MKTIRCCPWFKQCSSTNHTEGLVHQQKYCQDFIPWEYPENNTFTFFRLSCTAWQKRNKKLFDSRVLLDKMLECNYTTSKSALNVEKETERRADYGIMDQHCSDTCLDEWQVVERYCNCVHKRSWVLKVIITQLTNMNKLHPWLKEFLPWLVQESL